MVLKPILKQDRQQYMNAFHQLYDSSDMQYLSEILLPIKDAILSVEANHSTLADYQLCHIQIIKIISIIMSDIAETVFKEFEEERLVEEEDIELSNPTEDLYSNELDLNLNVLNFIDLCSSVFTNSEDRYENEVSNKIESDDDLQENEYDVDKIVSRQFNDSY
ncbi:16634_t:CDS:2 [Dentiscutata heterogama]|uniref:16634_t:CDS:1 n=1 Tax=Dentiscutata heterogama TaxID=1316150 RepID=A0ACA9N858_9GLOM|nr:16634_t:CDS:2 [Dentiscutata heterogama]